jgi:uncharacterized membrane protein
MYYVAAYSKRLILLHFIPRVSCSRKTVTMNLDSPLETIPPALTARAGGRCGGKRAGVPGNYDPRDRGRGSPDCGLSATFSPFAKGSGAHDCP